MASAPTGRRLPLGLTSTGDVALAVALGALALLGVRLGSLVGASADAGAEYVLVVALFVPLAWRASHPRAVAVAAAAAAAVMWLVAETDWHTAVAGGIAIYGLGRFVERPSSLRWFAAILFGLASVAAAQVVMSDVGHGLFAVVARSGLVVAAFWFGDAQRSRDQLLVSLRDRAERAEEHRRVVERQAVLDERNRIAREVHDVVAHSLSVMVVQATAAVRLAPHDADGATAAMQRVADVGRSAMGEMRQVLGLLDGDRAGGGEPVGDAFSPQPGLAALPTLIDRYRAAGLGVTVDGPDRYPALGASVELAVVRVVQEALTNALRYAPGAAVVVRLRFGHRVEVDVVDDGAGQPTDRGGGSGRGLVGMEQRVGSLGGTLDVGPRPEGGFAVRASFPAVPDRSVSATPGPPAPPSPTPEPIGGGGGGER